MLRESFVVMNPHNFQLNLPLKGFLGGYFHYQIEGAGLGDTDGTTCWRERGAAASPQKEISPRAPKWLGPALEGVTVQILSPSGTNCCLTGLDNTLGEIF